MLSLLFLQLKQGSLLGLGFPTINKTEQRSPEMRQPTPALQLELLDFWKSKASSFQELSAVHKMVYPI